VDLTDLGWFDWDDGLPGDTSHFLTVVRAEASRWEGADPDDSRVYMHGDCLVLGLDVCDRVRHVVLRTLRIDYGASRMACGEDASGQFVGNLTGSEDESGSFDREGRTSSSLGTTAACWLFEQMIRPIELEVWEYPDYWYRRYRLADTKRPLSWSAARNAPPARKLGPAHQITLVDTLTRRGPR
jgi:hypothetical protein